MAIRKCSMCGKQMVDDGNDLCIQCYHDGMTEFDPCCPHCGSPELCNCDAEIASFKDETEEFSFEEDGQDYDPDFCAHIWTDIGGEG